MNKIQRKVKSLLTYQWKFDGLPLELVPLHFGENSPDHLFSWLSPGCLCANMPSELFSYQQRLFLFITDLDGCSHNTGDVYKTRYCFKSPAAFWPTLTELCGNLWRNSNSDWWVKSRTRTAWLCLSALVSLVSPWQYGGARATQSGHVSSITKRKCFIIHSHTISLVSGNVNIRYYWRALKEYIIMWMNIDIE